MEISDGLCETPQSATHVITSNGIQFVGNGIVYQAVHNSKLYVQQLEFMLVADGFVVRLKS